MNSEMHTKKKEGYQKVFHGKDFILVTHGLNHPQGIQTNIPIENYIKENLLRLINAYMSFQVNSIRIFVLSKFLGYPIILAFSGRRLTIDG